MLNKNLEKSLKPMRYYQTLKNAKTMITMVLMGRKWEVFHLLVLIFQMLTVYSKDFLKVQDLITKMMRTFLVLFLEEEEIIMVKVAEWEWVLGFHQCSIIMTSLVQDLEKWVDLSPALMMIHQ
jgi:hypothetical protein